MATTGKAAFDKYFKGKEITTEIKRTTDGKPVVLYDVNEKKVGTIKQGEKIEINEKEYSAKLPITYKGKMYKVSFSAIAKPLAKKAPNLKPQSFKGITDKRISAKELVKALTKQVNDREDIPDDVKNYLTKVLVQKATKADWEGLSSSQNEIIKDFGEMIGAIILADTGDYGRDPDIFLPHRGNEPIIDYKFYDGKKPYNISAKAAGVSGTNTLKLADVFDFIDIKKYDKHLVNVLKIIADAPIAETPIRIYDELNGTNLIDYWKNVSKTKFTDKLSGEDKMRYEDVIKQNPKPIETYGEVFYYTETFYVNMLNNKYQDEIKRMFQDAIDSFGVHYAMLEISGTNPNGKVTVKNAKEFALSTVKLRTKNGRTRASDRIGVQM